MKYDHPEVVEPALEIIKATDPETYDRMQASGWDVHVITDIETDPMRLSIPGLDERQNIAARPASEALTTTWPPRKTDIVLPVILSVRDLLEAPVSHEVAVILVHEFAHHEGSGELPAYATAARFAGRLGDDALAGNQMSGVLASLLGLA